MFMKTKMFFEIILLHPGNSIQGLETIGDGFCGFFGEFDAFFLLSVYFDSS